MNVQFSASERGLLVAGAAVALVAIILTVGSPLNLALWLAVPVAWWAVRRQHAELGLTHRNLALAVAVGLLLGVGQGLLKFHFLPEFNRGFYLYATEFIPRLSLTGFVASIVLVDTVRELFYRGFLQGQLARHLHPFLAIILAAVTLGLADRVTGITSFLSVTTSGIIAGLLLHYSRNLAAPAIFIVTQFLVILALAQGQGII